MARREDLKRSKAAQLYRESGNVSAAAREAGVSRATLHRWLKDPDFLETIPVEEPSLTLEELQAKALRVIDHALDGAKISTAQMRAALEVTKTSGQLKEPVKTEGSGGLSALISQIDEESELVSD